MPYKIEYSQLPVNKIFNNVINDRKHFLDTIKIIAYRAETAMVNIIRPYMSHKNEARLLLKQVYNTDASLQVDKANKILNVKIHRLTRWKDDTIIERLIEVLNQTKTKFPDTDLTLFYNLGSS